MAPKLHLVGEIGLGLSIEVDTCNIKATPRQLRGFVTGHSSSVCLKQER
jgi:hypothetical protein